MEEKHEIINFEKNNPLKLFMLKLDNIPKHWHQSLELIFVLGGEVQLTIENKLFILKEDDIILINSNCIHELHSSGCVMVTVQIKLQMFGLPNNLTENLYFECNSVLNNNKNDFLQIKKLIALMIKTNSRNDESTPYQNMAFAYTLLAELMRNFQTEKEDAEIINKQKYLGRLSHIVKYVNEHYRENLTLNKIATIEHLSVPYLSSFFEKYMGSTFSSYYGNIRLEHAVDDLLHTEYTLENIALRNGYSEPRAFLRAFKKKYNTIPSLIRKNKSNETIDSKKGNSDKLINYLSFEPRNYLKKLSTYLSTDDSVVQFHISKKNYQAISVDTIDYTKDIQPLQKTFKTFVGVGRAKELLYEDIRKMLTVLQHEIGFEYVKFHGLLSDDMLVCMKNPYGKISYSFILIDKVLDFLQSIHLKPLIELSFMPKVLASDSDKNVFASEFNTSMPKNIKMWNDLIHALIVHLIERYGKETVETWLFCVWNEPDTSEEMFGVGNDNDFYHLYSNTYSTVKEINSNLKFGSPSMLLTTSENVQWAENFVQWTIDHHCVPEFLNFHYYSDEFKNDDMAKFSFNANYHGNLSKDPEKFHKCIDRVKVFLKDMDLNDIPAYLTEWNLTVFHRNPINDTCFLSCYITKNLLENFDKIGSFGYWSLTDFIEEFQLDNNLYHGGLGLFTYNGIKKASYYAFYFSNMLGDVLLAKGNGYFVTKNKAGIQIMCYNYEHFNDLFADGQTFDMTLTNRYTPFSKMNKLEISISINNLPTSKFLVREYAVNRKFGSSFDKWVETGALPIKNKIDLTMLENASAPYFHQYYSELENGILTYNTLLEPLEIRLIHINFD